ncbi:MAG: D-aminoacyl-tRNA deacylase [Acidimicrobiia bacterium]
MRAVIQRVSRAEVTVDSELVGQIGRGLLVLVGVGPDDGEAEVEVLADKLVGLRIFPDDDGRMNRSVRDVGGGVLVVSQFTLYGDARKGRRPSFVSAAPPEVAEPLVADLVARLVAAGVQVGTGRFGAMMEVDLVNSGPVTLILEVAGGRVLGS